ncbi:hypothetical protein AYI68_g1415 [Smittium mucronatum]|uniref:Uncharacterized protein n=1 Tax=Smittium mucronatum TaxID=133383 RepID=A0A1R0H5D5_9FUNG|nr:hypothetical protein AYI68_g1415 [Smittium mucronatum]
MKSDTHESSLHQSIVFIPYDSKNSIESSDRVQAFAVDLYFEHIVDDEGRYIFNPDGSPKSKSGVRILIKNGKNPKVNAYKVVEYDNTEASAYELFQEVYNISNEYYGFNNRFPPSEDQNNEIQEIQQDHPKAYDLGKNDCQSTSRMIIEKLGLKIKKRV